MQMMLSHVMSVRGRTTRWRGGRRWTWGERGSSAVEAAIVTPVVMALFFGIIEMGFVFKDYLAVAGSIRAGVRMASANPRNVSFAQMSADQVAKTGGAMSFKDVQELWVYKVTNTDSSSNLPIGKTDFANGCTSCVKFTWNNTTKKFVSSPVTADTWTAPSQNACSTALGGPPDRIGVYLKLKHDAFTGLVFKTVSIAEASIMSLEPMPVLNGCKP
jgi:Flp pilus assembly protein TadG